MRLNDLISRDTLLKAVCEKCDRSLCEHPEECDFRKVIDSVECVVQEIEWDEEKG